VVCTLSYADDNTIFGCYKKNEGQLRIVDQAGKCLPSEIPISWNKVGQSGPPGAQGLAGPPGPEGPSGISVQSTTLPEGDINCPDGGSQFTSVSGITYACNGEGTEGGATITTRRMETAPSCNEGYGWCPNGFSNSYYFRIRDSAVNDRSVVVINVFNPTVNFYRGCEVNSIGAGEFLIMCNGWNRVERGAILQYAVFNP